MMTYQLEQVAEARRAAGCALGVGVTYLRAVSATARPAVAPCSRAPTGACASFPSYSGSVDEVTREEFPPRWGLHESMRPARRFVRDDDVWEFATSICSPATNSEIRYVLHYDDSGDVDGYATYRFKPNFEAEPQGDVRVKEIWAEDPEAYASLWRYLLDLDLARTFHLLRISTSCATWSPTPAPSTPPSPTTSTSASSTSQLPARPPCWCRPGHRDRRPPPPRNSAATPCDGRLLRRGFGGARRQLTLRRDCRWASWSSGRSISPAYRRTCTAPPASPSTPPAQSRQQRRPSAGTPGADARTCSEVALCAQKDARALQAA